MEAWIIIAIISYFLFALNGVGDKFLLTHAVKDPGVYAFYLGISSVVVFVLAPFGLEILPPGLMMLALLAGGSFITAMYFFYSAIKETSISRILPIEGGLVPLFSLIIAYIAGVEILEPGQLWAFVLLVAGAVMMELKKSKTGWHPLAWRNAVIAAFFFGLYFVLTKDVYNQTNFISGLIWTRVGLVVGALFLLLSATTRRGIKAAPNRTSSVDKSVFYGSRLAGAGATFLQNYAISIGSVVIVNALQGVQFAFVLLMSVLLSRFYPQIIREEVNQSILIQKIAAVLFITAGLVLLTT
jgi:drug/metabolite transporter (DMT)-like permease